MYIRGSSRRTRMPTWTDILDQPAAVEQLRRAYAADRLPHGMIFAGPVGVGKGTTAAMLATLFLCERPKGDQPCGTCEGCRAMAGNAHPDYHVVYKELIRYHDKTGTSKGIDLSIHVIRPEVVERASRASVMNRGKVFVIEQADLMNGPAQNALLKTLEEPAGRTLVILLTDAPNQLLPTIRSRCQVVRFGEMSEATVLRELQKRNVPPPVATAAAQVAGTSLGLALRWIEDGVVDAANQLVRQLDDVFAGRPADGLPDWFKGAADGYAAKQLERDELGSKDAATREGYGLFLRLAADHVRQQLRELTDPDALDRLCNVIDAIARAEEYLDANVNVALLFQQLTISLGRMSGVPASAGHGAERR
jgi:DNA polymerase-3 subunit delta'